MLKKIKTILRWFLRKRHAEHLYGLEHIKYLTLRERGVFRTASVDLRRLTQIINNKRRLARYIRGNNPWRRNVSEAHWF